MKKQTKNKTIYRRARDAAAGVAVGVGLLFAVLISPVSFADDSLASDRTTRSPVVDQAQLPAADNVVVAATDSPGGASTDASAQVLTANVSREPPAAGAGPGGSLSLVISGAGLLVITAFLALAALNSRKRPPRLLKAQPDPDR